MSTNEIVSTRCEDYPCCGHGPISTGGDSGGCPTIFENGDRCFHCVTCGKLMSLSATSAICLDCSDIRYRYSDNDDLDYHPEEDETEYRQKMQTAYDEEWR